MNIVFTARKPSAVFQAIKGNFTGPDDLNLVLGKGTRIEVFIIGPEGLKSVKEFGLYGEIETLKAIRPPGSTTDLLLVTTTHYQMLTLSLNLSQDLPSNAANAGRPAHFSIVSDALVELLDRHSRQADVGQLVEIDPSATVVCCHLFHGTLKFIPINPHRDPTATLSAAFSSSSAASAASAAAAAGNGSSSAGLGSSSGTTSRLAKSLPSHGTFLDLTNLPIEEITLMSMTFLHGYEKPTLAVLFEDTKEIRHVKTYEIDVRGTEVKMAETGWCQSGLSGARMLIPVPAPLGGLLVIGDHAITYLNRLLNSAPRSITIRTTSMRAYGALDDQGSRYLLGDHRGQLYVLVLIIKNETVGGGVGGSSSSSNTNSRTISHVVDLRLELLGTTSIPEAIVYLDNNHLFVGSHLGDSQLIRLHEDMDEQGEYIEVVETFTNIGPVLDFDVVDLEGQGQGQIVSCSGAFKDGALRIVRNGVGLNDKAILELPGIKNVWSLRSSSSSSSLSSNNNNSNSQYYEDTLVLSFLNSTRIVRVTAESEMVQEEMEGFETETTTLLSCNVQHGLLLQVTPLSVRLIAPPEHIQAGLISEWRPANGAQISIASANPTQCLVAVGGSTLVYLRIGAETIEEERQKTFQNDIACIDVSSIGTPDGSSAQFGAIGLWTNIKVLLVRLPTLETMSAYDLPGEILPRSLLLTRFEGTPYLLVGLGDGQLLTFALDLATGPTLGVPKRISLGTQPILLRLISTSREGASTSTTSTTTAASPTTTTTAAAAMSSHVFACSDRPTVIHSSNRKLIYSNVNLKQVTAVSSFHCEAFPNALAIVGSEGEGFLRVGSIDEFQELHVQTFPIHESGRGIAYLPGRKCFGVISSREVSTLAATASSSTSGPAPTTGEGAAASSSSSSAAAAAAAAPEMMMSSSHLRVENEGEEDEIGYVRLHDDQTFDLMHSYELDKFEAPLSITSVTFTGDSGNNYLAVGTAISEPEEEEPSKGRILVFDMSESNQLKLAAEVKVNGAVFAIREFNGKLLCCINGSVSIYNWTPADSSTKDASLTMECSHPGFVLALHVATYGDFIVVGDVMKGLTLLRYRSLEGKIEEIARDSDMNWVMALEVIDDETFIGSDDASNLFTLVKNTDTMVEEEARRLEWKGCFHLGDQINRFRHGSLVMSNFEDDAPAIPKLLFTTVSGAVGVIATLTKERYDFFRQLENNLTRVIRGIGGLDHGSWRAFRNKNKVLSSENFIDGDLVEMFLDLNHDEINAVMEGANGGQPIVAAVEEVTKLVEELLRLH
ncbi:DNA damage-binding protein 1a [Actinomortierella ambigua]|uniref:DNA damage-binding protein 1a n=1 Tax=Actinomortierella ambigua TaxID=1343610 RepID=A0A9P6PRU3_9FUNG|nr:DNA damage-binding protein 1a [Actinomortierella ambigua]